MAKLYRKRRIAVPLDDPDLVAALAQVHVWPITREICARLSDLDFVSDPADELIAATSLVHNAPLLTRDRRIRKSKNVPLA
jgi:PIN domain nuclease of toxin-antitoxin system